MQLPAEYNQRNDKADKNFGNNLTLGHARLQTEQARGTQRADPNLGLWWWESEEE
ncbi:unnamed protein product, partial [marine sediment metagenome]